MTPNGECQIISPDQSQIFDAGVNFLSLRHQCENPYRIWSSIVRAVTGAGRFHSRVASSSAGKLGSQHLVLSCHIIQRVRCRTSYWI